MVNRIVRILAVLLIVGGSGYGIWAAVTADWAAYGPAVPPDVAPAIDTSLATLKTLKIGGFDALTEPLEFQWSQFVPVELTAPTPRGTFRIKSGPIVLPPSGLAKLPDTKYRGVSVFLNVLRKSSHGDGSRCVHSSGAGARVGRDNILRWSGKLGIPEVPGDYLLEVQLRCGRRINDKTEYEPITIAVFPLKVIPEPGSDS
ncbi:MAG: hypothetical protein KF777_12395 [Planctomycetaceae bacterium]|nr:hypothetical protein [Planctomycetaceae bacterium]